MRLESKFEANVGLPCLCCKMEGVDEMYESLFQVQPRTLIYFRCGLYTSAFQGRGIL